jgi:predicted glycosyltransferase
MTDYEYQSDLFFLLSKWLVPEIIPDDVLRRKKVNIGKLVKYPGIKEEVYTGNFEANPTILDDLNIERTKVIVSIRPPATEAHYHNPESERLLSAVIPYLCKKRNVIMVVLPRTEKQRRTIRELAGQDIEKIKMPETVLDGLNLIWHSDLVISGGGTMNREAAALGVPAYSIFTGEIGAVDRYLERSGRLQLISSLDDIKSIRIEKRTDDRATWANGHLIPFIVNEIVSAAR